MAKVSPSFLDIIIVQIRTCLALGNKHVSTDYFPILGYWWLLDWF